MNGLIGNTPMVRIYYSYKGKERSIYTKLEYYNLTGSIKDRMVSYILLKNKNNGNIKEGQALIEATSGNTGISLAALGALYKHPVYIFMPDFVSEERIKIMKLYGANVTLVTKEEGGYETCIKRANELATQIDGFRLDQFERVDNITAHYQSTGTEIVKSLLPIDGFISGIGTGGTLMGTGMKIKDIYENAKIIAMEPKTMTLLSKDRVLEDHKIEGISDGFMPRIVDKSIIDDVILVDDKDAIYMSQKIAKELGIGVGISSGANLIGAILLEEQIGGNICTIFADDQKKYLSTDMSKEITPGKEFVSCEVELLRYEIV